MKIWARWLFTGCLLGGAMLAQAQVCSSSIAASTPTADFVDHGNGTATHSKTGLMWSRCAVGQSWNGASCTGTASALTWQGALQAGQTATTAGHTDWRLPNLKELRSIVEEQCSNPSVNTTVFPGTSASYFWSASAHAYLSNNAWVVNFSYGYANYSDVKSVTYQVRLVRAGQSFGSFDGLGGVATPVLAGVAITAIGQTSLTLNATSNTSGTGYWLAVATGATAPSAAQVKSGVNYAGVTIAASGYGAMAAAVPRSFTISGLASGTGYDFYVVAMDASANLSPTPVKVQGSTLTVAAAPVVSSFVFDPIADQGAGVPVPVRIRAVDGSGATLTGFNDIVQVLGLNSAKVAPSSLKFASGVAVANVSYLGSGVAKLSAQYNRPAGGVAGGASNQFLLTTAVAQTFTVSGKTILGTAVQLVSTGSAGVLGPVANDANGVFTFLNVPAGEWEVLARPTQAGYSQVCQTPQHCRVVVDRNITFNPEMRNGCQIGSTAVIFIPGIMGSTLRKDINTAGNVSPIMPVMVPKLPKEYPAPAKDLAIYDPTLLSWAGGFSDNTAMGHRLLVTDLEQAGFCVVPTPWDWRMPFKEAADTYLKPAIANAKAMTGRKVYIVAHSMGGLVARSYIEQWNGGQDVERFVMLGTPNYGATNAYYLMEGGDPLALDELTNTVGKLTNTVPAMFFKVRFYGETANELYRTEFGDDIISTNFTTNLAGVPKISVKYKLGNNPTIWMAQFMNTAAKGGRDLLPTYGFLRKWVRVPILNSATTDLLSCVSLSTPQPNPGMNTNLNILNNGFSFSNYYAPVNGNVATPTKTQVRILLSDSESTLKQLCYVTEKAGAYRYGAPDPGPYDLPTGDGTVLLAEGRGPFPQQDVVIPGKYGKHTELLGNAYSRCRVMQALLAGPSVQSSCAALALTAATKDARSASVSPPSMQANIEVTGPYSALLTASDGKRAGTVAGLGGILEEIVDSAVGISPYQANIIQQSPVNGTYRLQISNDAILANTAVRVSLGYSQPSVDTQTESLRILAKAVPYLANIVQDNTAARWMTFVDPVQPPLALKAVPQSDLTQLNWAAPVDPTATGYNIYYRTSDDDRFVLLGQTAATSFATTIPWAGTYDASSEFIVLSTNAAGVESPIRSGNSVRNISYARAAFSAAAVNASGVIDQTTSPLSVTFIDQSDATAAIQSWAWDFNSDGTVDSTAQNPTFSFPQVGSYTVSLTVTSADSSTDTKVFQNFVNIRALPDAPFIGTASAGDAQAAVSFGAPGYDGNAAISAYTVTCTASGQTTQSASGPASPLTVSGLSNAVAYSCTATATNSVGTGAASDAVAVTPVAANTPVCTLTATPAAVFASASSTLSANCTLAPTSYVWSGGTCAGGSVASCIVAPTVSTTYGVAGVNANGLGAVVRTVVEVVPPPMVSLTPATLSFANQNVGATSASANRHPDQHRCIYADDYQHRAYIAGLWCGQQLRCYPGSREFLHVQCDI